MSIRPILVYGDPRLEAPNAPVESFDSRLRELVDDLFETGWKAPGLGLAAPQVGVNLRLATVDLSVGKDPEQRLVLANPVISQATGSVALEEGCLSFPGLFTTLQRPREIVVSAQDGDGTSFELSASGLLAQAICHEIDHIEGRLLVHHLRGIKKKMFLRRVAKMRRTGVWTT